MTEKEAIEILQHEHNYAQLLSYVNEAIKIAIAAIEKQIPRKPIVKSILEDDIQLGFVCLDKRSTVYICPAPECKEYISRYSNFCHKCGQALDWSDTE